MEIPSNVATSFFKSNLGTVTSAGMCVGKCPSCDDYKTRLYLLNKDRKHTVYCHNCGYSSNLLWFIKNFYPTQYDYVMNQCVTGFFFDEKPKPKRVKKEDDTNELLDIINQGMSKIGTTVPKKKSNEVLDYLKKYAVPFNDIPSKMKSLKSAIDDHKLILRDRKIPEDVIDSCWYIYKRDEKKNYKDRVAIPFLDDKGEMYFFQAMATGKQKPKYLNWNSDVLTDKPEYNEYNVDRDKRVYIVEGLFDSMFVDNSVSTMGANLSFSKIKYFKKKYPNRVWILDNPRCDKTAHRMIKRLLDKGEDCVIFPYKYRRVKDMNELALLLKRNNLNEIIEENVYNSITGLIELGR